MTIGDCGCSFPLMPIKLCKKTLTTKLGTDIMQIKLGMTVIKVQAKLGEEDIYG